MSKQKHTPTPWYIHDDAADVMSDWGIIRAKCDDYIVAQTCNMGRYTEEEADAARAINFGPKQDRPVRIAQPPTVIANAELIVRSVNAHAALIACVETSICWLEDEAKRGCLVAREDLEAAKAALAMAKGSNDEQA